MSDETNSKLTYNDSKYFAQTSLANGFSFSLKTISVDVQ